MRGSSVTPVPTSTSCLCRCWCLTSREGPSLTSVLTVRRGRMQRSWEWRRRQMNRLQVGNTVTNSFNAIGGRFCVNGCAKHSREPAVARPARLTQRLMCCCLQPQPLRCPPLHLRRQSRHQTPRMHASHSSKTGRPALWLPSAVPWLCLMARITSTILVET